MSDADRQHTHAEKIRQERYDRDHPREKAEREFVNKIAANLFERLMDFAQNAKPAFVGQESRAERSSFDRPGNVPAVTWPEQVSEPPQNVSRSGVEGGSITFVVCKDNGDGTFTQGKVTADATFVPDV